ncbi:MAG: formyltetrahydrofolate deformylase [Planctomycetota bacterium]
MTTTAPTARLLIASPDAQGIVAAVAGFIAEHCGNLLDADQHTDMEHGEFFMRAVFDPTSCDLNRGNFADAWQPIAQRFNMSWSMRWSNEVRRMAILVGRQAHCLQDLLWRHQAGELDAEISLIISNHETLRADVEHAGIRFEHCPVTPETKPQQEQQIIELLESNQIDVTVLARYMQILSPAFVDRFPGRIINIHHSFLPAFVGGDPYRQAYERGVKIIGATSHYVTSELDAGPIIAQAVTPVSHRDTVADLKRKGRDLERMVLARAVRAHLEDRILTSANRTVVFE